MKKQLLTLAFSALGIGLILVFAACGADINQSQRSGGESRISVTLDWPDGYRYDPATARLYGPGVYYTHRVAPSYVTSITVTVTGEGVEKVYNVSLETGEVEDSIQPGKYTISVVVETSIGLTFTGSTTVILVSGQNDDIVINLEVNAPPTSDSIVVSNSRPFKNESITITINVTDLDEDDVLTYYWSASGGRLSGSGDSVTWSSDRSGAYSVTVTVEDGSGGVVTANAGITVVNRNPVITSVSVDNPTPNVGDTVNLSCNASDLDNDPLSYSWVDGAGWSGRGATAAYTVTVTGTITLTCTVTDGDGGSARASVTLNARMLITDVVFADANLKTCVLNEATANGWTYTYEVTGTLDCSSLVITSLSGMENFTNLTVLYLYSNSISNVSPLSGLTNLTVLDLTNNSIIDVSPLASLTNLTNLWLEVNSIGGQKAGNVDSLITLTSVVQLYLNLNTGMSCAEANTLICGAGNAVSAGICSPASTGLGTNVDINSDGFGTVDEPIDPSNCTNP